MSNPVGALKAVSHRDALGKTVRLLTRDGLKVHFRGHQPHVKVRGNRAIAMVLPELGNDCSEDMLAAIHGYLDHEFGHIQYTPFAKMTRAGTFDKKAPALLNIVEDIRLEKLLPRDYPGTKLNLERMYETFIPKMIDPATQKMVATGDPSKQFAGVMVPALRALSGQKAFQQYMDANSFWQFFMPLMVKMPKLARRLKDMETFDDVVSLVEDMINELNPPPPPPEEDPATEEEPQAPPPPPPPAPSDDGDDDADDADDADDGEGHGDGSGTDDEEGDEDDNDCSGDPDPDADAEDGDNEDEGDQEGEREEEGKAGGNGNKSTSITDAIKQLEPTQRKALFLYKKDKKTVAEIADVMNITEDCVGDLLRTSRRRLSDIMKGQRG